ncbi:hypothetical protein ACE103_20375 [Bradyrhizobium sp. ma5]|uniref:hypothetical protein n=1 Tax=Bradyrhizobium sp. ma5 TaxID=3344828 RepID=UPI0035D4B8FF
MISKRIAAPSLSLAQQQALRDEFSACWINALDRCVLSKDAVGELTLSQARVFANGANDLLCNCHGHPNQSTTKTPVMSYVKSARGVVAMIDKKDQKQWGEPELDKAQAETDVIFAEMDGLKGLVESGEITIEQAQARFKELLERHRLVGERLRAVARAWGGTPGNA